MPHCQAQWVNYLHVYQPWHSFVPVTSCLLYGMHHSAPPSLPLCSVVGSYNLSHSVPFHPNNLHVNVYYNDSLVCFKASRLCYNINTRPWKRVLSDILRFPRVMEILWLCFSGPAPSCALRLINGVVVGLGQLKSWSGPGGNWVCHPRLLPDPYTTAAVAIMWPSKGRTSSPALVNFFIVPFSFYLIMLNYVTILSYVLLLFVCMTYIIRNVRIWGLLLRYLNVHMHFKI